MQSRLSTRELRETHQQACSLKSSHFPARNGRRSFDNSGDHIRKGFQQPLKIFSKTHFSISRKVFLALEQRDCRGLYLQKCVTWFDGLG